MYKHILIATDGSELARKAVVTGLALAKRLDAKATAVTATVPWTAILIGDAAAAFPVEEYERSSAEDAARILSEVGATAEGLGIQCEAVRITDHPAEGIIATAKSLQCDLIVMSSHGRRGLTRLLLGSQAMRVLTLSSVPVLICR